MDTMIDGTSLAAITDFVRTLGSHNRYAALAGLRHCKVLVLSGDADRSRRSGTPRRSAAELPEAELIRADGAGHMVMLEQADLVTGHLVELVRSSADGETKWTAMVETALRARQAPRRCPWSARSCRPQRAGEQHRSPARSGRQPPAELDRVRLRQPEFPHARFHHRRPLVLAVRTAAHQLHQVAGDQVGLLNITMWPAPSA